MSEKALMRWLQRAFQEGRVQAMLEGMFTQGFMNHELWQTYLESCDKYRFRVGFRCGGRRGS